MNVEERYFDYTLEPGRKLNDRNYLNDGEPLISIITPYYNCKEYIKTTANCIINQTFPYWEWIIVNDGSTEDGTEEILNEIKNLDNRIIIINQENQGRLAARDNAIKNSRCELIYTLDSDDQIDITMLECCYWSLMTNQEATWVYADMANFDGKEFLWNPEFDCEKEKKENILPVSALIRKKALLEVGCYGAVDKNVHEDWHLWLRMLSKGYFPIRMNFYGFWYRNKKEGGVLESFRKDKEKNEYANKILGEQAKKIKEEVHAIQFPTTVQSNFDIYPYTFEWNRKPINIKGEKIRLLFIFPWFNVGGADKFNYDLISGLDKDKYEITIITTEPSKYIWRQRFEEFAEVFDLTTFLQRKDWAAFIHYIMKSRNIDIVMESNSYYGYYAIPWLKAEFPDVVFTDYLHSADWRWRNGAYPRDSVAIDGFLDRTYTCTNALKNDMKQKMNRTIDNVKPIYIGVDEKFFDENNVEIEENKNLENNMDKIKGKKSILFLCRISEEKRPIFILKVFKRLLQKDKNLVLLVVGDGPILNEMKETSRQEKIDDNVIYFGMQENVKQFYKVADVTVICSLIEGLTITTYESLAMSTPVVTADIGGQKELVDETCGRIVKNIQLAPKDGTYNRNYTAEEIERYAVAIGDVLDEKNYSKLKQNCRRKILNGFTINNMINTFDMEFQRFAKEGTSIYIDKSQIDLYKQFLTLYNEIDKRIYNPSVGGIYDEKTKIEMEYQNYKNKKIKEELWANPIWRMMIRILQITGVMKLIKKLKIDKKIKNILRK